MSGRLSCVNLQSFFEGEETGLGFSDTCIWKWEIWVYLFNFSWFRCFVKSQCGVMERAWTLDTDGPGFKSCLCDFDKVTETLFVLVFSSIKSECYYLHCRRVLRMRNIRENMNKYSAGSRNSANVYWADIIGQRSPGTIAPMRI